MSSTFAGLRDDKVTSKLNFLSLMLALFCGTASLPHILIRYYTVKDQASARKSTVVGIGNYAGTYTATGRTFDARVVHVWRVRDGQAVAFEQIVDSAQVRAATD